MKRIRRANKLTDWVREPAEPVRKGFNWFGLLFWVAVILLLVASCYQLWTEGLPY